MNHTFLQIADTVASIGDAVSADHFIAKAVGYCPHFDRDMGARFAAMTEDDRSIFRAHMNRIASACAGIEQRRRRAVWNAINSMNS